MAQLPTHVLNEVLSWPIAARAELAERLLESLDSDDTQDADAAWAEELRIRIDEVRSEKVIPVPWEEARRQIMDDTDGDAG